MEVEVESHSIWSSFSRKSYQAAAEPFGLSNIHRRASDIPQISSRGKAASPKESTTSRGKAISHTIPTIPNHLRSLPSTTSDSEVLYRCSHCASDTHAYKVLEHLEWHIATKLIEKSRPIRSQSLARIISEAQIQNCSDDVQKHKIPGQNFFDVSPVYRHSRILFCRASDVASHVRSVLHAHRYPRDG
jgi:hypothetical protein